MNSAIAPLPPLVVFDRVTRQFGGRAVLRQASFVIERSEFVVLLGGAGCGKSLVLRLIAALDRPTGGTIIVAGQPLADITQRALPHLRRSIGIVPQELMLLEDRSVLDNVALPAAAAGLSRREARSRAAAALERVGLDAADASVEPAALSGSARQRVALARALVNRPALLLLDDPLAHLADRDAAAVLQVLEQFVGAGVTVVLAAHSVPPRLPTRARIIDLDAEART